MPNYNKIFYPFAFSRAEAARLNDNCFFFHYTDAGYSIIENEEIWMTNARNMKDGREIKHGKQCLSNAIESDLGKEFSQILDAIYPNLSGEILEKFEFKVSKIIDHTYISCFSEHDLTQDTHGCPDMWEAFGAPLALVFNRMRFLTAEEKIGVDASPVAYLSSEEFGNEFKKLILSFEDNIHHIRQLEREEIVSAIFDVFRSAIICTKRPKYSFEREWRVFYTDTPHVSTVIYAETLNHNDSTQKKFKIPLKGFDAIGVTGLSIPELLRGIVLRPGRNQLNLKAKMVELLSKKGISNAGTRVIDAHI